MYCARGNLLLVENALLKGTKQLLAPIDFHVMYIGLQLEGH